MNNGDTWVKLHTSILLSRKIESLPDNEHRWAYMASLCLAKKGVAVVATGFVAGVFRMGLRRLKSVLKNLVEAGLIDESGNVIGFEDSQLSGSAIRMRRHRERHSDATVTGNVTTEVEVEVDKIRKEPLEIFPGRKKSRNKITDNCDHMIPLYNSLTGRKFRGSIELSKRVTSLSHKGYSIEEQKAVMKYRLKQEWWQDKSPTAVLSPTNFGDDLQASTAGNKEPENVVDWGGMEL